MPQNNWRDLKEKLADIEHQRWSDWQKYMHSKFTFSTDDNMKWIPIAMLKRWERQIDTPYSLLTRQEQESDLHQVERYWPIIESTIAEEVEKARLEERVKLLEYAQKSEELTKIDVVLYLQSLLPPNKTNE